MHQVTEIEESESPSSDLQNFVLRVFRAYAANVDVSLWPWENARWHELVFSLLTTIVEPQLTPKETREITRFLAQKNLLNVDLLGDLRPNAHEEDALHPTLVTIKTLLQQSGFTSEEAVKSISAICDAAHGLKESFEGKVQNYYREYGKQMLSDIPRRFNFATLSDAEAQSAFAIWLQNSLNMPVPASNPRVDALCKKLGVKYGDIVDAADSLDMNIGLLDDALRIFGVEELEEALES